MEEYALAFLTALVAKSPTRAEVTHRPSVHSTFDLSPGHFTARQTGAECGIKKKNSWGKICGKSF